MVSSRKNKLTSAAGINLGAIVTNTKGIATQRIHINGTIIKSLFSSIKLSIKNNANVATNSLPTTAAGTKFFDLADLSSCTMDEPWIEAGLGQKRTQKIAT